ncbi:MAG: hypothetical protein L0Y76_02315 [Ignavibacteria bacterium]|nr:hypothetical protein [Ignavibacteria bacterium]
MKYIIIILFALSLLSCGKSSEDRQKTLVYLEKSREFVSGSVYSGIHFSAKDSSVRKDESGKYFLDEKKYRNIYNAVLSEKFDSIASACGFRDFREADSYVIEFKEDKEVKPVLGKYVQELKEKHDSIEKEVNSSIR